MIISQKSSCHVDDQNSISGRPADTSTRDMVNNMSMRGGNGLKICVLCRPTFYSKNVINSTCQILRIMHFFCYLDRFYTMTLFL